MRGLLTFEKAMLAVQTARAAVLSLIAGLSTPGPAQAKAVGLITGGAVGFGVGVGEAATAEVFVGVGVAVVAETVLVEDGEALGDRLGDAVVSICLISIPSSQTMFLPTFIAVHLRFRQIIVCPIFRGQNRFW